MPLGKGVRYRMTDSGVRLAFKNGQVVEAKNMETGKTHSAKEFAADRKRHNAEMNKRLRGK